MSRSASEAGSAFKVASSKLSLVSLDLIISIKSRSRRISKSQKADSSKRFRVLSSEIAYEYIPIAGQLGKDILKFSNNEGHQFTVNINVLDNSPDLDAVKDDAVFTAIDQTIEFNVAENDLSGPFIRE